MSGGIANAFCFVPDRKITLVGPCETDDAGGNDYLVRQHAGMDVERRGLSSDTPNPSNEVF